jgi:hypothetical protein
MILSGWILPNLVDGIQCRSFSNLAEHISAVQKYLEKLDETTLNLVFKKATQIGISSYDDIAVLILGWIKLIDYPHKAICYIAREEYELIVQKYLKLGYSPIELTPKYFIE